MKNFLLMGGYASSVWPSVALTFGIIAWNIVAARRSSAAARADAQRRVAAGEAP